MKKFLASLGLSVLLLLPVWAQSTANVTFTWTPNPAADLVSGYRLEYMKLPVVTNWTFLSFTSGATNVTSVTGLQGGYIYMFRMFGVNGLGVGTNSSTIIQIPTNTPVMVQNFQQK